MAFGKISLLIVVVFAVAAFAQSCGKRYYSGDSRIVGGSYATTGEWPWQVSLTVWGGHTCGGTILNNRWILTAAHCMSSISSMKVIVGQTATGSGSYRKTFSVSKAYTHAAYNDNLLQNDIAMIKVSGTISFNNYVQPACLPKDQNHFTYSYWSSKECWISGWGGITSTASRFPTTLKHLKQPIVSDSNCNQYYGYNSRYTMCTGRNGGSGVCSGDSGGPMSCRESSSGPWYVAGVASFTAQRCGTSYDGYTRVGYYTPWINSVISNY